MRIKDGKYINPDVAEVVAKIDELEAQSSQGSFKPSTRMDILSTAIGKPDDLGHVRGEPRGVSATKYFGRRRRFSHDDENPSPQLGKPNEDIKHIFTTAIKTSKMFAKKKEGVAKEPKWFYSKCPQQPGHTECGYYVILYMFYIIQSRQTTGFEPIFGTEAAYSEEDIDLGRDALAGYLLSHVDV
ncbi:hypothetical protein K1719_017754 [Acacia pycnantha]|nr:hypothetical protein K1719_017754 [Acacia pycnantha]